MYMCVYVEPHGNDHSLNGQRRTSGILFCHFPPYIWRQGLSLTLQPAIWLGWMAKEITGSLSHPANTEALIVFLGFYMGVRDLNSHPLPFESKCLYPLRHPPSYISL